MSVISAISAGSYTKQARNPKQEQKQKQRTKNRNIGIWNLFQELVTKC